VRGGKFSGYKVKPTPLKELTEWEGNRPKFQQGDKINHTTERGKERGRRRVRERGRGKETRPASRA